WDPVLSAGLQLRGKVVDPDGKPVAKVMVEAMTERPARGEQWSAFVITDAEGGFTINNCVEGRSLRLEFRRKFLPEVIRTGVLPSVPDLVVTIPKEAWVYIEGIVLGPEDLVLPNASAFVSLNRSGSGPVGTVDAKTGAFRYGPYPPGS